MLFKFSFKNLYNVLVYFYLFILFIFIVFALYSLCNLVFLFCLLLDNAIVEINISASQSPVSGQSVSDSNDTLSSFLNHSNSVEYNMSKCDIENSNVENSQKNNHNDECVHSSNDDSNVENSQKNNRSDKSVHSSSDDSNKDFGHNNEVEAPEKIIGMGIILHLSASLIFGVWWILIYFITVVIIDMVKNLVYMVKVVKETQRNHGILLEEIVQRLKNKGITISHPEGMPQIPLQNISTAEKMEKCLALSTTQMEYLVSTDLKPIHYFLAKDISLQ